MVSTSAAIDGRGRRYFLFNTLLTVAAVDDVIFDEFITGRVAGGLSEEIPNMHL